MKKSIFTLTLAIIFCTTTWAKVRTVSQDAATPAQYPTITAAITASLAGDTIYIHGSVSQYPTFTLTKVNLTFIGAGYAPSKDNPLATMLTNVNLDTLGNNQTGRGAKFYGLNINEITVGGNWGGAQPAKNNNVVVARCFITYFDVCGDNWTVKNNVINGGWFNNEYHSSTVISNNIFNSTYMSECNQPSVLIANNLFFKGGNVFNSTITLATITNNIFVGTTLTSTASVNFNTENNNLTYHIFGIPGSGELLPLGPNNTGTGNIQDNDPMFNYELTTGSTTFSLAWDFTLQPGSPALTASSSGGEIGLYGGTYPWVDNTGMAAIPFVQHMNISGVVPVAGNINIDVKAKRHN